MMPPRIRGKVGSAEPGQGYDGKWFFTIHIADLYGEDVGLPIGPFGPYDTESKAKEGMRGACQVCAELYEKEMTGKTSGQYLDMLNGGVMRKWQES